MNKRTTKKIQPEQMLNSEQKADDKHVSPVIANTNVSGSFFVHRTKTTNGLKANELRIGNWLMGSAPFQVKKILSENTVGLDAGDPYYIFTEEPFKPCLAPIALTEEWAMKLGFTEIKKGEWFKKGNITLGYVTADDRLQFETIEGMIDLWFVHQLQNLYFCLSGQELEIVPNDR